MQAGVDPLTVSPTASMPATTGALAGWSDASLRSMRWLGAAFTCLQFLIYTPPIGVTLPFSRWIGVAVAAPLVVVNLLDRYAGPRSPRAMRRWHLVALVADCLVATAVLWLFAFDAQNALWALLVLPVLEGALRAELRGALITWLLLALGYAARDLWASAHYDNLPFYADSVTFRMGIIGIVAATTGSLFRRLRRSSRVLDARLAEVAALRQVATAARRLSSLDVEVITSEVVDAANRLGFRAAWLSTSTPPQDAAGRRTVEISADCGGDVGVALHASHDGPVPPDRQEALDLLAAQVGAVLVNARRYTERQQFEDALRAAALHDGLTGLPNRALLADRATQALAAAERTGRPVAVLLMDLDRFKEINDTFGHGYGDTLLVKVAARLTGVLRGSDTAARLGGDEFALLAVDLADPEDARRTAERVVLALREPFSVHGVLIDVEASVGVAIGGTHGNDIDTLLRCADIAMYAAKRSRQGVEEYDPDLDEHTPQRLSLLGDLRRALDVDDQLDLYYQPKFALDDGRMVGVETLVRWNHPTRGEVSPSEFIPVAEGTALIHALTSWVLARAVTQAARWVAEGTPVQVAVNLSARCLLDQRLPLEVAALLSNSNLSAGALRLEITESAVIADPARAIAVLTQLQDLGIALSLDDFGTGYSSMSYLQRLPVDELKVDRSFVTHLRPDANDTALVRAVIDLAHSVGLTVVAEGVETAVTLQLLRELGCDVAQGFHLGRPVPADLFDHASTAPGQEGQPTKGQDSVTTALPAAERRAASRTVITATASSAVTGGDPPPASASRTPM